MTMWLTATGNGTANPEFWIFRVTGMRFFHHYHDVRSGWEWWSLTDLQLRIKLSFQKGRLNSSAMQSNQFMYREPIGWWRMFLHSVSSFSWIWFQRIGQTFLWGSFGYTAWGLPMHGKLNDLNPYPGLSCNVFKVIFLSRRNSATHIYIMTRIFVKCFRDPIRVPRIENRVLRIRKNIIGSLQSEKIGSLESAKSGPYRSIPGTNIFLKKNW